MSCTVKSCKNTKRYPFEGISFHVYPRTKILQEKWLEALGLPIDSFIWSRSKIVCSKHFLQSDFKESGRLKPSAVPSLFLETIKIEPVDGFIEENGSSSTSFPVPTTAQLIRDSTLKPNNVIASSGLANSQDQKSLVTFISAFHSYSKSEDSPKKTANECKNLKRQLYRAKKKINDMKQQIRYLKSVIIDLKAHNMESKNSIQHIKEILQDTDTESDEDEKSMDDFAISPQFQDTE